MSEIWKDIKGYEGFYQISNFGRVKSLERVAVRSNGRKHSVSERILKSFQNMSGYTTVALRKDGALKTHSVHKLVANAFIGVSHKDMTVNHIDGVKANNNLSNLEICTRSYNLKHAFAIGLRPLPKGEINGNSKLNNSDIMWIRKLYSNGEKQINIWRDYYPYLAYASINDIVKRRTWKHI